jgi:hypothetical protein
MNARFTAAIRVCIFSLDPEIRDACGLRIRATNNSADQTDGEVAS